MLTSPLEAGGDAAGVRLGSHRRLGCEIAESGDGKHPAPVIDILAVQHRFVDVMCTARVFIHSAVAGGTLDAQQLAEYGRDAGHRVRLQIRLKLRRVLGVRYAMAGQQTAGDQHRNYWIHGVVLDVTASTLRRRWRLALFWPQARKRKTASSSFLHINSPIHCKRHLKCKTGKVS